MSGGDSIIIIDPSLEQHKIRLASIDAPEIEQSFGDKAKKHLADMIYGRVVFVTGQRVD